MILAEQDMIDEDTFSLFVIANDDYYYHSVSYDNVKHKTCLVMTQAFRGAQYFSNDGEAESVLDDLLDMFERTDDGDFVSKLAVREIEIPYSAVPAEVFISTL